MTGCHHEQRGLAGTQLLGWCVDTPRARVGQSQASSIPCKYGSSRLSCTYPVVYSISLSRISHKIVELSVCCVSSLSGVSTFPLVLAHHPVQRLRVLTRKTAEMPKVLE